MSVVRSVLCNMYSSICIVQNLRLLLQWRYLGATSAIFVLCDVLICISLSAVIDCVFTIPFMMCSSRCGYSNIQRISANVKTWVFMHHAVSCFEIQRLMLNTSRLRRCCTNFWPVMSQVCHQSPNIYKLMWLLSYLNNQSTTASVKFKYRELWHVDQGMI